MSAVKRDASAEMFNVSTLMDPHNVMRKRRPGPGASLAEWLEFHQYGVKLYTHVADIDRGHHHEALDYWAVYERQKAEQVTARIAAEKAGSGVADAAGDA